LVIRFLAHNAGQHCSDAFNGLGLVHIRCWPLVTVGLSTQFYKST